VCVRIDSTTDVKFLQQMYKQDLVMNEEAVFRPNGRNNLLQQFQ